MARKALVELIGDPSSLLRSFRQSSNGAQKLERDLKDLAVTAKQSAEAQIQAAVKRDARLRQEIVAYRQIASAAKKGSTEQVIAARKAAEAEGRLSRSLGVTAREQRALATSAARTERQLGRATRGTLAGSGALRSMGRSLAFASAGFIGFAAAAQLLRTSITAASDLTEEINKSNVVFRGSEKQVQSWSKTLIPAFGLTRAEALQTAGTFGNMLVPMGFVRRRAAEMSERLVELAGDMASFNNASPEDTLQALRAGLANQPRPLRRFGVFLDQARIAAEALSSGIVKANVNMGKVADAQTKVDIAQAKLAQTRQKYGANSIQAAQAEITLHNATRGLTSALGGQIPKLTTAQRTLAIYRLILKDTADAHGDAARTGNAFAGQMRSLHAELGNLQEELGTLLLPTVLHYTRALTDWLGKSENQKRLLKDVKEAVRILTGAIAGAVAVIKQLVAVAKPLADVVGGWARLFELAAGAFVISKFVKLAGAIRAARTEMALFTAAPWVVTVTVAVIGLNEAGKTLAKKLGLQGRGFAGLGDDVAGGAGDLLPRGTSGMQGRGARGSTLGYRPPPVSEGPFSLGNAVSTAQNMRRHGWNEQQIYQELRREGFEPSVATEAIVKTRTRGRFGPVLAPSPEDVRATRGSPTATVTRASAATTRRFQAQLVVPFRLQLEQARAEALGTSRAIASAARDVKAWVLRQIPKLKGQGLIDAYGLLAQANATLAQQVKEAASFAVPMMLQLQQARAEAFNNQGAIVAAAKAIRANILKQLPHLRGEELLAAYSALGQANSTIASAAKDAADKAKAQAAAAKQKLAEARQKMQEAIDNVRQQIGELFQGPILAPTEQQQKARLGAPGPKPEDLVRDLRAQTALFARFNRDLVRLQKLGAPKELIKELRAQGTAALPEIEALLGASKKIRDEFFKAFRSRERLVQRVAKVEMRAQNVNLVARNLHVSGGRLRKMAEGGIATGPTAALVGESGPEAVIPLSRLGGAGGKQEYHLYIDGKEVDVAVTRQHQRRRTTTAAQVRGRHPGRTEID